MKIKGTEIGKGRTFIIAEIGINHDGEFQKAMELIKSAYECGVDAVKFQAFNAERLISKDEPAYKHSKVENKTQFDRLRSLEFTAREWEELASFSEELGLIFMASVFDKDSCDMIEPLVHAFKIASGDVDNIPLLRHVAYKNKPTIISTGCSELDEVRRAISYFRNDIAVLHCISAYPPEEPEDLNLNSIPFMKERLKIPVGYSDHTRGTLASLLSVALGADIIEKHFTLDSSIPVGDHPISADPSNMKKLVHDIRWFESAKGGFHKKVAGSELDMRDRIRRGIYAGKDMKKGQTIKEQDIVCLRPRGLIPVSELDQVVGRKARRDIKKGEPISFEDII